jgi:hypothetical protein
VPAPAPKVEPVAVKTPPPAPAKAERSLGPASKVTAVDVQSDGSLVITGNGAITKVKSFGADVPNRIVVDVYGVAKGFAGVSRPGAGKVAKVRIGEHDGKIRFVLDLKQETGPIPAHALDKGGDRVTVRFP